MAGRPIGSKNGTTASAKMAILECFRMLGGVDALYEWAKENQTDFYRAIYPKLIPLTLSGDKENPIESKITVEFVSANSDK